MNENLPVANDVYERYGLKWADFPTLVTPSAHSDEAELFCAKQSMAVYGVYPNTPHAPDNDYIPSRNRDAMEAKGFDVSRMIEGAGEGPAQSFEGEQGYRVVVSDKAGALMVWRNDHLVIAFRGTANWQDWIHNFTTTRINSDIVDLSDDLELHKGFTGLSENIAPAVIELVDEFSYKLAEKSQNLALTLCGHSLGGALALNFAAILSHGNFNRYSYCFKEREIRIGATYTFGAPRIGKGKVWKYIHRPHYRLIVPGDPVPRTPLFFTDDFEATYLERPSKDAKQPKCHLSKIWKAIQEKRKHLFDIRAHYIENYIDAVQKKIDAKKTEAA